MNIYVQAFLRVYIFIHWVNMPDCFYFFESIFSLLFGKYLMISLIEIINVLYPFKKISFWFIVSFGVLFFLIDFTLYSFLLIWRLIYSSCSSLLRCKLRLLISDLRCFFFPNIKVKCYNFLSTALAASHIFWYIVFHFYSVYSSEYDLS